MDDARTAAEAWRYLHYFFRSPFSTNLPLRFDNIFGALMLSDSVTQRNATQHLHK